MKIDLTNVQKRLRAFLPTLVRERVSRGIDKNGNRFEGYSEGYKKTLARMGESDHVDLMLSGGFLADIKTLSVQQTKDGVVIRVGAGTKTSPTMRPPPVEYKKNGEKKKAREASIKTGEQGPQHNVLGRWMQDGTNGPAREWLGYSKEDMRAIMAELKKELFLKPG